MQTDYLRELGYLAVATRLKRLGDRMMHSGRAMYKSLGWDIEPNWYLIFKLLDKHGSLSLADIAEKLRISHPSVIAIANKMTQKGYLSMEKCQDDARKKRLSLTPKSIAEMPQFEQVWTAGTKGMEEMMEGKDLLVLLTMMEDKLAAASFQERTLGRMNNEIPN